ncbi:hypothetical protein E2C01_086447 [Portunus trituberculatus]|uniref:Uncharacterized protein n=1 Tax=Portunus trituberculatus TaxID=210409 RepID=A0A5B7J5E9_PORTR|nr:hypothetical protein [Portunus trituberculatus]
MSAWERRSTEQTTGVLDHTTAGVGVEVSGGALAGREPRWQGGGQRRASSHRPS